MVETEGHSKLKSVEAVSSNSTCSKGWKRGYRLFALVISILTGCGTLDGDSPSTRALEEPDMSSDGILVCPYGGLTPTPWYAVRAMNNKLRHFPDFARTTGLSAVRNCAEGRQFMRKYQEYAERVPYFDQDEPLEESDLPEPEPPTDEELLRAMGSTPKIRNGTPEGLGPIVWLGHTVNPPVGGAGSGGGGGSGGAGGSPNTIDYYTCTGTFIARNFIMTAAHCLQVDLQYQPGVSKTSDAHVEAFYNYKIEFIGADGRVTRSNDFLLRQYMDPRYVGFEPNSSYLGFDFALLYFLNAYDAFLPPLNPALTGERFPLMRLSLAKKIVNFGQAYFWGTGRLDEDVPPAEAPGPNRATDPILRKGSLAPFQTTFKVVSETAIAGSPVKRSGAGKFFEASRVSSQPSTVAGICSGDSGGPLVERWTIRDERTPTATRDVYVAVGVASHIGWPYGSNCNTDSDCSGGYRYACHPTQKKCWDPNNVCVDQVGEKMHWTPIFQEAEFIKSKIRRWAPRKCSESVRVTQATPFDPILTTGDKYLRCWGSSCLDECKDAANPLCCAENQYCSRSGSALLKEYGASFESNCALVCGSGNGCGCIYGQCLDGPVFDPTGEGGASSGP